MGDADREAGAARRGGRRARAQLVAPRARRGAQMARGERSAREAAEHHSRAEGAGAGARRGGRGEAMSHASTRDRTHSWLRRLAALLPLCALVAIATACGSPEDPLDKLRELQAAGRFAETVDPLRRLVDEDPARMEAQLLLGLALLRTGETGLAVWPLRRAAESPEHAVRAGILLARAQLDGRSADDAIRSIDRVLAIEPGELEALQLRVEAHLAAGSPDKALEDIDRVFALEPENFSVLVPRVLALIATLRIDEAEAALETAREQLEASSDAVDASVRARLCVARGLFAFEKGDAASADDQYAACLSEFPVDPLVVRETVAYYDRSERSEDATEILRSAAEASGNSSLRMALAQRMGASGDAEAQQRLLRQAAEEQPSPTAWFALADYYVRRDEFEPALDAFERALQTSADPPLMLRFAYADTLVQAGRLEQALALAEQPDHEALRELIRGRVLLERGDARAALAAFEAGIRLWPNNASSRFLAGQAAERIGDFERAVVEYRESVRANAAQTKAGLALAELQLAAGASADALDVARRYANSHSDDPMGYLVSIRIAHRAGHPRIAAEGLVRLATLPGQAPWARAEEATLRAADEGPAAAVAALENSGLDLDDPSNAPALRVLLAQLAALGDHEGAERRSAAALASHPGAAVFHELHARALRSAGRPSALYREGFERAVELDPEHAPVLLALAELAAASAELDAAVALYDRAAAAARVGVESPGS
ncbi:MAG: tetratricopeptide repeat protein, partial [Myxococcales bacterium]